jgi:hypothetical protein
MGRRTVKTLPDPFGELCAMLSKSDGAEAMTIGGSRATETCR